MDSLFDPSSLRGQTAVEFREEQSVDEQEEFDYFESIDGLVAVGVTNAAGAVLLMNSSHGWRLPYGPVDVDEDWVLAGQNVSEELAGVSVSVIGVERVAQITRYLECDGEHKTTSYDIVLRTDSVTGEPVSDNPGFGPWDELEVDWFDTVPEDAYWGHGDAVDDIRLFLE